jgi:hypothetical protein
MKPKIISTIFILIIFSSLSAIGSISEIWKTLTGHQPADEFGGRGASLDYNGDGIDDLLVSAPFYHFRPEISESGRVEIFFGKEQGFADSCDLALNAIKPDSLSGVGKYSQIIACGDVNGDGYDDLATLVYTRSPLSDYYSQFMEIYCGGPQADTLPDITVNPPDSMNFKYLRPLGDVNGDGFDDIGFTSDNVRSNNRYYVLFGGSFTHKLIRAMESNYAPYFTGIGDINADGYSDMGIAYGQVINDEWYYESEIFFGSPDPDTFTDIYMSQYWPGNGHEIQCISNPFYIGDWNGDGFDDCIAYNLAGYGASIWAGGPSNTPNIHTDLNDLWPMREITFDYGDVNGDGKSDLVTAEPTAGAEDGAFAVYLGSRNGTPDYGGPDFPDQAHAGWMVCVGDYDNDGFDDIAIGARGESVHCPIGKVYIFKGSANLVEQNPEINPSENETVKPQLEFSVYPNPGKTSLNVKIKDPKQGKYKLEVFNIKGQKVYSTKTGKINREYSNTLDISKLRLANGVYLFKLNDGVKSVAIKKITIMK